MIRQFNYTQRKRIEQQQASIELHETDDGNPPTFSANLVLDDLRLPADARLVIVAMDGRAAMRFDWGTAGAPAPPADCRLTAVPYNPTFRVMALDADRKILALANSIRPKRAAGRESLLWLQEDDLGQEIWRLDFSNPGHPTLLVNRSIANISAAMRQDDHLRGLALPAALRALLIRALIVEDAVPDDDAGDWGSWLGFVDGFYDADYPGLNADGQRERNEISAWIDGAVAAFTQEKFPARELYAKARA